MIIIRHRAIFFWITGAVVAIAIASIAFLRLPLSIDFTGGSLTEVGYTAGRPDAATVAAAIESAGIAGASVRATGDDGFVIRSRPLTPSEQESLIAAASLAGTAPAEARRITTVGPALGNELATKALYALLGVSLAIMAYVAWAFRRVSRPVPSWVYGLLALLVLVHDVLVAAGFYAILAFLTGAQVDALFAVALLAILGYSVNDTIVIFDRVRENLDHNQHAKLEEPFDQLVGRSITETLGRSINTSVAVMLALGALIVFGSQETLNFALVLFAGVVAGTYSSILLAAPLLVPIAAWFERRAAAAEKA